MSIYHGRLTPDHVAFHQAMHNALEDLADGMSWRQAMRSYGSKVLGAVLSSWRHELHGRIHPSVRVHL